MKLISVFLILLTCPGVAANPEEWKGWRGLEKQACADSAPFPVAWSSEKGVAWKIDIEGEGHSSPVADKENIFITSAVYDKSTVTINSVVLFILLTIIIGIIILILVSGYRNILIDYKTSGRVYVPDLYIISFFGLLIFIFLTLFWIYFDENRNQPERILLSYLFSGSVFLLNLFLFVLLFQRESIYRKIIGTTGLLLIVFLILNVPLQDYYMVVDFFQIWSFPVVFAGIILPAIFSACLVFRAGGNKHSLHNSSDLIQIRLSGVKKNVRSFYILSASLLALGISGFLVIPAVGLARLVLKNYTSRIQDPIQISSFFSPSTAYPYFLVVIGLGFFLLHMADKRGNLEKWKRRPYTFPIMLLISVLFFVFNNYAVKEPQYKWKVICVDRKTGQIEWEKRFLSGEATAVSNYNSQATPTPFIWDKSIYAYFGSAGMISLDTNGTRKWENRDLPFESIHGAGSSPIPCSHGIVLLNSMGKDSYLTLLDFNTGNPLWKTELGNGEGSSGEYRTPILFHMGDREYIIDWSYIRNEIALYDSGTGEAAYRYITEWSYEGEPVTTVLLNDSIIYLSCPLNIAAIDLARLLSGRPPMIWLTDLNRKGPCTSSPVMAYGLIFAISDNGFVSCLNSVSGQLLWQTKLPGTYFSSPVVSGGNVYFSNTSGLTTVISCSSVFNKISVNKLPEGIYSTLVPVDGQIFIRTKKILWCIQ